MTDRSLIPASTYGNALLRALKSFGLLRESIVGMIGAGLILFWIIVAIFAPLIAPYPPNATIAPFVMPWSTGPDGEFFLLGTDMIGRDILSRIIWGSRTVLLYAPLATLAAYVVGIAMGLAAGYLRGRADDILSRIGDIILSFPVLVLYILIIATIGDGSYFFGNPMAAHYCARAYDLPILFIVVNNHGWGAVRRATKAMYPDGKALTGNDIPLSRIDPAPDYEMIIEACGGYGERVTDPDALPDALARAVKMVREERRQVLLNVVVSEVV
ncbi:MAG: hypothetical protein HN608_10755 [Rhodospirillaceae bacterium]|nr:hypothetical protein [Rhodospirillaceae bacterium]